MTTPTPTHASAVLALLEFARNVSQDNNADCNGWASAARAALATWEQRPRLRDDRVLAEAWENEGFGLGFAKAADMFEAHLFDDRCPECGGYGDYLPAGACGACEHCPRAVPCHACNGTGQRRAGPPSRRGARKETDDAKR